jgi:ribosomal protein S18 acetylase RimI-like enzyme
MHLLDNIFWNALEGPQAHLAVGSGGARRYAPGYYPVAGFKNKEVPDFIALAEVCELGEQILCAEWHGPVPFGWQIDEERSIRRMVWDGPIPANDQAQDAIKLSPEHANAALELAGISKPGPFGVRSIELGEYFGYFENGRLVAMAGEGLAANGLREITGVCTHPDFAGRGMARRLVTKLVRRRLMRGEIPFLDVMQSNTNATLLYKQMGFRDHCLCPMRIISRCVTGMTDLSQYRHDRSVEGRSDDSEKQKTPPRISFSP